MKWNCILLKIGELALKGKNRQDFENRLIQNLRQKLKNFPGLEITREHGRIYVELGDHDLEPILDQLKEVFGLVGFSPALRVKPDFEEIKQAALYLLQSQPDEIKTFKIESKRADKRFPIGSQEMNQQVGKFVLPRVPRFRVDVHTPDLVLHIEVRANAAYLYGNDLPGAGGLPVGSSGRVLLLLSGGIDSPVAGYLALKRGARLEAIHFHSYPYTSERAKQKVIDLAQILTRYGGKIRLHIVPFTEIQTEINRHCENSYLITIMRRFMLRIAERIAINNRALALVTGESLGQVASQTLESMRAINAVTNFPILRPLVGMDKVEIMDLSRKIGTYETSILPYEDCCTVFLPKSPKTRPSLEVVEKEEQKLAVEELVQRAVEGTEVLELTPDEPQEEFTYF